MTLHDLNAAWSIACITLTIVAFYAGRREARRELRRNRRRGRRR